MKDTGMTSYTEIDMVTGTEKTEMIDTGMTETDMMDTMGEDEDMGETDVEEKSVPGKPKLSVICPNLEEEMAEADTNASGGSERMMLTIHEINTEICKNILEHVCEIMVKKFLPSLELSQRIKVSTGVIWRMGTRKISWRYISSQNFQLMLMH